MAILKSGIDILEKLNALSKAAFEPETPTTMPRPKRWVFQRGREYIIFNHCPRSLTHKGPLLKEGRGIQMRFLRDKAIHHIFQSVEGGWLECFTDVQLMDYTVREADWVD